METGWNILIFNGGSSSLSYKIFQVSAKEKITTVLEGKAHRVGVKGKDPSFIENKYQKETVKDTLLLENHKKAAEAALKFIKSKGICIDYIGHRFVHGGENFKKSIFIDDVVINKLNECLPLAPIHNPISLDVIIESIKYFPEVPNYIAFDSAFHSSIPSYAYSYMLPKDITHKFGFRKYGFHGLSYSFIADETSRFMKKCLGKIKIVACHLGTGGSSVCAIDGGRSVDTSMGYSPLTGLMMSTRCGDIDPMLAVYLMAVFDYRAEGLMELLNKRSGLLGVSGFSSDLRDIIAHDAGEEKMQAELSLKMYVNRLEKYIGSYIALLKGIDALVFTDDIGVKNGLIKEKICDNMSWAGVEIDKELNRLAINQATMINTEESRVKVIVIPTEEELTICMEGIKLIKERI